MNKYFFIGIGGISMSAIALILKKQGYLVEGSDIHDSPVIKMLRDNQINVYIGHDEKNIKGDETIIYTAAISKDNPELLKAKALGLKIYERAEFLGMIMKNYENVIAISGTHGKTTTTSMIGYMLKKAALDPTILVGAFVSQLGGNFCIGKRDFLVAEACEYVDSFLKFRPTTGIILNIDNDHLDYFKDIEAIKESFFKFASLVPDDGFVIANADDKNVLSVLQRLCKNKILFSAKEKADFWARDIKNQDGFYEFDVYHKDDYFSHVKLNIPGFHNIYNALAAISTGYLIGLDKNVITESLQNFCGAARRLEKKGEINGVYLYDDYAHHPTEITSSIESLKSLTEGKLIVIFQPHTFSRLKNLMSDFAKSLSSSDYVVIADVYAAREKNAFGVTSYDLFEVLSKMNPNCKYIGSFEEISDYVMSIAKNGDIVATIGAGDINKCLDIILQKYALRI